MARQIPDWVQTSMLEQEILEVIIHIGVVVEGDHLQAQIEVKNPVDGTMLDLRSWPHFRLERWHVLLREVAWHIEQMVADQVGMGSELYRHLFLRELLEELGPGSPPPTHPFA